MADHVRVRGLFEAVTVADLDRSVAFYRDLVGLAAAVYSAIPMDTCSSA